MAEFMINEEEWFYDETEYVYHRGENGQFGVLNVRCESEIDSGTMFFKVYIDETKKEFVFEIDEKYDNYYFMKEFTFLNVEQSFAIPSDLNKITLNFFMCYCKDECYKKCTVAGRIKRMKKIFQSLESVEFNKCQLCLQNVELKKLNCNHKVDLACLEDSIPDNIDIFWYNPKCPVCRKELQFDLQSTLVINDTKYNNDGSGQTVQSYCRKEDGTFYPLKIFSQCEGGYGQVFLKAYVREMKKEFIFKLKNRDIGRTDDYYDTFDFLNKDEILKHLNKITVHFFMCLCEKECFSECTQCGQFEKMKKHLKLLEKCGGWQMTSLIKTGFKIL